MGIVSRGIGCGDSFFLFATSYTVAIVRKNKELQRCKTCLNELWWKLLPALILVFYYAYDLRPEKCTDECTINLPKNYKSVKPIKILLNHVKKFIIKEKPYNIMSDSLLQYPGCASFRRTSHSYTRTSRYDRTCTRSRSKKRHNVYLSSTFIRITMILIFLFCLRYRDFSFIEILDYKS